MQIKKPRKGRYFYVVTEFTVFRWIQDDGTIPLGERQYIGGRYWPYSKALVRDAIAANNGAIVEDRAWVHQFETKTSRFVKTIKRPGEPWIFK